MQPLQNNDLRTFPSEKKKGLIGSTIIHTVLFLILFFVAYKIPPPPEFEGGIMVNFGTDETGFGLIEPAPLISSTISTSPQATRIPITEESLLTQNFEEAPEVRRVDPNAEIRRREQAEAERIRRENLETERRRIEAEEIERQRIAAEEQQRQDIINRTRNALAGGRNVGSESSNEGVTGGSSNQGVLTGSLNNDIRGQGGSGNGTSGTGSGAGVSYDLGGRVSLSLPLPRYNYQSEGRVVVEIRVDREGRVTQADAGKPGSTTIDEYFLNAAREAALQAKFAPDPNAPATQIGTITYNFVLR